jgi:hypothetical protein
MVAFVSARTAASADTTVGLTDTIRRRVADSPVIMTAKGDVGVEMRVQKRSSRGRKQVNGIQMLSNFGPEQCVKPKKRAEKGDLVL